MMLAPTALLLFLVIKLRCMVSKLRNKAIFQKEKVILFHTVLFSLYFVFIASEQIAYKWSASVGISTSTVCKAGTVDVSSSICVSLTNSCIFILITFMSVQFCKPLAEQWQHFLLGYSDKSLDIYLREQYGGGARTDQEKAERFHKAAVLDANRQIAIISALLNHTQINDQE